MMVVLGEAVKVVGLAKDHQVVEDGAAGLKASAGAVDFVGDADDRLGVVRGVEAEPAGEESAVAEGVVAEGVVGVFADGLGAIEKKVVPEVGAKELA